MIEGFPLIEGVFFFLISPPAYPVKLPSAPRTLWQGHKYADFVMTNCTSHRLGRHMRKVHAFGHISWRVFRKLWFHHKEFPEEVPYFF